ncbi:ubiquitin-like protein 7 [Tubulanus polymorphus]|uniref:ubiquitin-like protein 7 n=1 Tax=Tubulanus polymorphus TaxID=672921 RepID=UPI003DA456EE
MTVFLGNRTTDQYCRILMNGVSLDGPVSKFRKTAADTVNLPVEKIELIYCGRALKDAATLESYGIKEGVTIHALKKQDIVTQEPVGKMSDDEIKQTVVALRQAIMLHPGDRRMTSLTQLVSNPDSLDSILAATPGLDQDPIALAMLQSPQLLGVLADPNTISKVLDEHPCLGHAAMHIAVALNEEAAKGGGPSHQGSEGSYSLDQMSDDDEFDAPLQRVPMGGSNESTPITATQLAAALAAATGRPATQSAGQDAAQSNVITADFFQQAMQQALSGGSNSGGASSSSQQQQQPQLSRDQLQSQLQQLRDMGISDENAAVEALQATGGNVQLALSILFGDHLQ